MSQFTSKEELKKQLKQLKRDLLRKTRKLEKYTKSSDSKHLLEVIKKKQPELSLDGLLFKDSSSVHSSEELSLSPGSDLQNEIPKSAKSRLETFKNRPAISQKCDVSPFHSSELLLAESELDKNRVVEKPEKSVSQVSECQLASAESSQMSHKLNICFYEESPSPSGSSELQSVESEPVKSCVKNELDKCSSEIFKCGLLLVDSDQHSRTHSTCSGHSSLHLELNDPDSFSCIESNDDRNEQLGQRWKVKKTYSAPLRRSKRKLAKAISGEDCVGRVSKKSNSTDNETPQASIKHQSKEKMDSECCDVDVNESSDSTLGDLKQRTGSEKLHEIFNQLPVSPVTQDLYSPASQFVENNVLEKDGIVFYFPGFPKEFCSTSAVNDFELPSEDFEEIMKIKMEEVSECCNEESNYQSCIDESTIEAKDVEEETQGVDGSPKADLSFHNFTAWSDTDLDVGNESFKSVFSETNCEKSFKTTTLPSLSKNGRVVDGFCETGEYWQGIIVVQEKAISFYRIQNEEFELDGFCERHEIPYEKGTDRHKTSSEDCVTLLEIVLTRDFLKAVVYSNKLNSDETVSSIVNLETLGNPVNTFFASFVSRKDFVVALHLFDDISDEKWSELTRYSCESGIIKKFVTMVPVPSWVLNTQKVQGLPDLIFVQDEAIFYILNSESGDLVKTVSLKATSGSAMPGKAYFIEGYKGLLFMLCEGDGGGMVLWAVNPLTGLFTKATTWTPDDDNLKRASEIFIAGSFIFAYWKEYQKLMWWHVNSGHSKGSVTGLPDIQHVSLLSPTVARLVMNSSHSLTFADIALFES